MPQPFHVAIASELAAAFRAHEVEYLLIGKGGAIVLGYPGTTLDVDVFPAKNPENAERIVRALRSIGFNVTPTMEADIRAMRDFVQITGAGPFQVDIIFAPDGIASYDAARKRRIVYREISVAALEDIIASKKASAREKDRIEMGMLEDFKTEYERLHPKPLKNAWEIDRNPPE